MRKFLFFRSSPATDKPSATPSEATSSDKKIYWEKPWQSDTEDDSLGKASRASKKSVARASKKASAPESDETSASSYLRRSLSFSSSASYGGRFESEAYGHQVDGRRSSPSDCYGNSRPVSDAPIIAPSSTPERSSKSRRRDSTATRKIHASERIDTPNSTNHASSGKSPQSSPVPLRCRSARFTHLSSHNAPLDLYIDGEQQEIKPESRRFEGCLVENRTIINSRKPPRAHSTAPSSPTHSKENLKCQPIEDARDSYYRRSMQDWTLEEFRQVSPQKLRKKLVQKLPPPGRSRLTSREYDSETVTTTTVEDIYEDTQDAQQAHHRLSLDNPGYNCSIPENQYHSSFLDADYMKNTSVFSRSDFFLERRHFEVDSDEDLSMKLKDAEKRYSMLSEVDIECEEFQNNCSISSLMQTIQDINRDRKHLALELLTQVQCRVSERASARDALKQAQMDLDTRTRRLEREKQEIQTTLEKEIDRRSGDWLVKLEKFQAEEQRLRERVRDLAEQNVSLQREVSSLTSREVETHSRIMNLEMQLNELTDKMEEIKKENENLHRALAELKERCDSAEADRECMKRGYNVKDKESKDLQKIVVRLQRTCDENEKTITGLRRGWNDEISNQPADRADAVNRLQLELIRLTGVELTLRKEVESCRSEVESLRVENISLLDRLKNSATGCGSSVFRLESEVHRRVEFLQSQGLSLLNENSDLCRKLLGMMETQQLKCAPEISNEFDSLCIMEYNMKFESLRRGIENLKRSLLVISGVSGDKFLERSNEKQLQADKESLSNKSDNQRLEDDIQLDLKAEMLLTRVLQEKLCYNELEIERLQGDLASSIRGQDALKTDIQRLQDEISSLAYKAKDMEREIVRKDESSQQLEQEYEELSRELNVSRGLLTKISEERDCLWEEVKRSKESDMLLNHEVTLLKKKVESLEEDNLVKEGQISILKDSLANQQPFDMLCSPDSLKEYSLA